MITQTHRMVRSAVLSCVLAASGVFSMSAAAAEPTIISPDASTYRFLVGFGVGGIPDLGARLIADELSKRQGKPAIVINKPGVGGTLAALDVLAAAPDGTTILSVTPAHATAAAVYREMRYDTLTDFTPVTLIGDGPALLVVPRDSKFNSVEELLASARANPGSLSYSSAGVGSSTHFGAELLKQSADIDVLHVPYRGVTEALTEVVGSRVDFTLAPYVTAAELVRGDRVRALGVAGTTRLAELPDVPTVSEACVPGYEWTFWYGLLVSSKTPEAIVQRLNQEAVAILNQPDIQERLNQMGVLVAASTPEAFRELIEAEVAKFKRIADAANIQPQ